MFSGTVTLMLTPYSLINGVCLSLLGVYRYIRLLGSRKQSENGKKLLLKAVLAVLDGFRFCAIPPTDETADQTKNTSPPSNDAANDVPEVATTEEPQPPDDDVEEDVTRPDADGLDRTVTHTEIANAILKVILPKLYNHLTTQSESNKKKGVPLTILRPQVALAIVKVLMKLPRTTMDAKLPQLLTRVTGVLRDRLESSRDGARVCLGEITKVLGPSYFAMILRELTTGLSKGFQLHVLGYVVSVRSPCISMLSWLSFDE